MPFEIVHDDITRLEVDAIVNATNPWQEVGSGVSRAIYEAAGYDQLAEACRPYGKLNYGDAFATSGFRLPVKYIIHTATPRFVGGLDGEYELLKACYLNSLRLAMRLKCESIAFPLLGSGGQGYPEQVAFRLASDVIQNFLLENDLEIKLVIYDRSTTRPPVEMEAHIQSLLARFQKNEAIWQKEASDCFAQADTEYKVLPMASPRKRAKPDTREALDERLQMMQTSFSPALLRLIDQKGMSDAQVYKKANLTRQHFSKIRNNPAYVPSKMTVLALAVALELNVEQTQNLLSRAGYTLSKSIKADLIVEYFLQRKYYDIYRINEALFFYDQPLLGARVS